MWFTIKANVRYYFRRVVRLVRYGHWRDDGGEEAYRELKG